jgi:hypothetical protein
MTTTRLRASIGFDGLPQLNNPAPFECREVEIKAVPVTVFEVKINSDFSLLSLTKKYNYAEANQNTLNRIASDYIYLQCQNELIYGQKETDANKPQLQFLERLGNKIMEIMQESPSKITFNLEMIK